MSGTPPLPSSTSPASLANLPPDLKHHLLGFIPTLSARLALARSCRDWYQPAIAAAYRDVRFAVCRPREHENACTELAMAMLAPENVGLKSLQHLTLVPCQADADTGEYVRELRTVLGLFAHLIPRNQLVSFCVDSCHVLEPELITVLHRRQRLLQTLRLDGWRTGTDNCLSENLLQDNCLVDVSHVQRLQLFISNKWKAEWFNIPSLPALVHLEIYADIASIIASDGEDPVDPQHHHELSQLIIEDVFGPDHDLAKLQVLALRGLDLQDAGTLIRPVLESRALRTLTLHQCRNATALIQHCAEDNSLLPGLQTLNIASAADRAFCVDVNALNLLLLRLPSLRDLLLSLAVVSPNQPAVHGLQAASLVRHAETLRYAYLDIARHDPEAFVRKLRECTKLKQLAIPNLGKPLSLSKEEPAEVLGPAAVEMLQALPELRTLYLLDDLHKAPDLDAPLSHRAVFPALRSHRLASISTHLFTRVPQLNVVGIGRRKKGHHQHPHDGTGQQANGISNAYHHSSNLQPHNHHPGSYHATGDSNNPTGGGASRNRSSDNAAAPANRYQQAPFSRPEQSRTQHSNTGQPNANQARNHNQHPSHNQLQHYSHPAQSQPQQQQQQARYPSATTPTEEAQAPAYYMRAKQQDLDGSETVLGTEVEGLERLRAVEPEVDVLDVVADGSRIVRSRWIGFEGGSPR